MVTLPDQASANVGSAASNSAAITTAQNDFIASATVLINQAINNGFFQIEPYMVPLVTSTYITTYFQALGYTVTFPVISPGPWGPCFFPAGFPEVIPPGLEPWNCHCGNCGPIRIKISWGPPVESFLLLEDGSLLELEVGPGGLFLE